MRQFHGLQLMTGLLLSAMLIGCGGGSKLGQVSGTVSLDGELIPEGAITFIPEDGKGPTAGSSIKDGRYTAKDVSPGKVTVRITSSKIVGTRKAYDTPDSPVINLTEELLPDRYNTKSELTLDVKPGANEKNWELKK